MQVLLMEALRAGPLAGNDPSAKRVSKSTGEEELSALFSAGALLASEREMESWGAGVPKPFSRDLFTSFSKLLISASISCFTSAGEQQLLLVDIETVLRGVCWKVWSSSIGCGCAAEGA